jgi:hypothetical protein
MAKTLDSAACGLKKVIFLKLFKLAACHTCALKVMRGFEVA